MFTKYSLSDFILHTIKYSFFYFLFCCRYTESLLKSVSFFTFFSGRDSDDEQIFFFSIKTAVYGSNNESQQASNQTNLLTKESVCLPQKYRQVKCLKNLGLFFQLFIAQGEKKSIDSCFIQFLEMELVNVNGLIFFLHFL